MAAYCKTYDISNEMRKKYRGGTVSMTVTEADLNPWYFCRICQHCAREPTCCPSGDVFCKECILDYILSHKAKKTSAVTIDPNMKNEIDKFLDLQRIVPKSNPEAKIEKKPEVKPSHKKKSEKKVKVLCPQCNKKIKYQKLLDLTVVFDGDIPICKACGRQIVGETRAMRLDCSDVICNKCLSGIAKQTKQCPVCHKDINIDNTILLNKTVINLKQADGKIVISHQDLIDSFG
ncbi:hypothetical protein TVAG_322550 [Trichomonas vaginalis G3]|uniref:RING-type domain-containing protein n=1 Tax=Trichomonas vaginalis (strain ATCC PRA-98 / G3) TaxID=412133 RepID=A2EL07_TRIV3|nr:ENOS interacting protein family [Trichomonas vaginalis G3]EAY06635.1 hypothetical protein TVAG_322550 [Trichomonas vaginalis G3]KAI5552906.1 ENOS interacting protein family [Trichomonas vaginalis G3]|eukprot:XP_001318858.1 hypothetical protein [Trichomonas vaginalis G3]